MEAHGGRDRPRAGSRRGLTRMWWKRKQHDFNAEIEAHLAVGSRPTPRGGPGPGTSACGGPRERWEIEPRLKNGSTNPHVGCSASTSCATSSSQPESC